MPRLRARLYGGPPVYRVEVHRTCGHVRRSHVGWNTGPEALEHGRTLLVRTVCGVCRKPER